METTSMVFLKERASNLFEIKRMLQQFVKKQEIKPELDGSLKKKEMFMREAANSHGLQHHSCKESISELKHKLHKIQKSQETILEEKRVETHPSEIKKVEGIQEIKHWLER
ncbi:putative aarF domain-containing protein kinase [Spatholobus suberectus]|nr:putative aarF domain-containing protein kinase [Spatholobus suberectus]TKY46550.1 putative aarF domain-containing protein kinase [Spatholobus suberectus]